MRILGLDISWSRKSSDGIDINTLIRRLDAIHETISGISVTPENCTQSPTVHAIVTAVTRSIGSLPVHVYTKSMDSSGRVTKELMPNHPVAKLLSKPNDWQTQTSYWMDATSALVRYGNYYAFKGRGVTGPIRRLEPLHPGSVSVEQDDDLNVTYKVHRSQTGAQQVYTAPQIHHVRGPGRDFLKGDSPVNDVKEAIALEIAAEKFGASFFGNGAMPFMVFKFAQGVKGFKTEEERNQFVEDFHAAYGDRRRFRAMLAPAGIEPGTPINVENDKAQFIETRKYQRTVIAGAFGIPPHLVGDLERATFNNVEQQSLDFVQTVVLPYARMFETAMERDLLTDQDRAAGIVIRFNLDAALRGDFKTRQEGMKIMREAGALSPNEWREREGMNPRDGGDTYYEQGPSGQQSAPGGGSEDAPEEDPDSN